MYLLIQHFIIQIHTREYRGKFERTGQRSEQKRGDITVKFTLLNLIKAIGRHNTWLVKIAAAKHIDYSQQVQ